MVSVEIKCLSSTFNEYFLIQQQIIILHKIQSLNGPFDHINSHLSMPDRVIKESNGQLLFESKAILDSLVMSKE